MELLIRLFRRETVSTDFIPVIDGLRFLAIAMVVLFHINAFVFERVVNQKLTFPSLFSANNFMALGYQGVQLFFVISGFILAVPFLREQFGLSERKPSYKSYILRRITRLEPPYIIAILGCFALLAIFSRDKIPMDDLLLSLGSSLAYAANFVFPGEKPHINVVTWSLEIEVQYYLIAPFVVTALCSLKGKVARRAVILFAIVAFGAFSWWLEAVVQLRVVSLANYFQYFLAGILLCDVYLLDRERLASLSHWTVALMGIGLLLAILLTDHALALDVRMKILSPLMIMAFYLITFGNTLWNRVFSLPLVTLIGGMCYSIYLIHAPIVAIIGRFVTPRLTFENFYVFFAVQSIVSLALILAASSVYFLCIEKPFMSRDWYKRFVARFRGRETVPQGS